MRKARAPPSWTSSWHSRYRRSTNPLINLRARRIMINHVAFAGNFVVCRSIGPIIIDYYRTRKALAIHRRIVLDSRFDTVARKEYLSPNNPRLKTRLMIIIMIFLSLFLFSPLRYTRLFLTLRPLRRHALGIIVGCHAPHLAPDPSCRISLDNNCR